MLARGQGRAWAFLAESVFVCASSMLWGEERSSGRSGRNPAGQRGRLLHPGRHLRLVELSPSWSGKEVQAGIEAQASIGVERGSAAGSAGPRTKPKAMG